MLVKFVQIINNKKLNYCLKVQRQQLPYLNELNNILASHKTSDEIASQVVKEMIVEFESILRINAGQRDLVLQNLNEIQDMIEDLKQEVVTKEISRHKLNTLISTSIKNSQ